MDSRGNSTSKAQRQYRDRVSGMKEKAAERMLQEKGTVREMGTVQG